MAEHAAEALTADDRSFDAPDFFAQPDNIVVESLMAANGAIAKTCLPRQDQGAVCSWAQRAEDAVHLTHSYIRGSNKGSTVLRLVSCGTTSGTAVDALTVYVRWVTVCSEDRCSGSERYNISYNIFRKYLTFSAIRGNFDLA